MAQLYPVEVRLTRKWSAPSIKHARYGGSLAAMVARGSFNTVSGTASCHYSMQECWSFPRPRTLNSCGTTAKWRHGSRPPAPSQSSNRRPWFPRNRTEGLPTSDGVVPAVAGPASVAAGGGIKAATCAACWPRQNAFESSGLVLRNPILLLSILAISGIACSGTSPASTPAATDFNRASCPGLKSRCLSGLRCRTSGSPQPHRQTGFWNQPTSVTTWDLRRAQARFIDYVVLL